MATAARKVNWFAILVSVAVVLALVVTAAIVVWSNNQSDDAGPAPQAASINAETGAIEVGTGEQTLDTYIDFMCPICNQFEQAYGESIQGLVDDGTLTLNIHPIAILDRFSQGTEYSTRAANAMYCVAETAPDAAVSFMQTLYANQPAEGSTGLTDEQLIEIAGSVGAEGVDACVTEQRYSGFVSSMTQQTPIQPGQSGIATPTLAVNGEVIANDTIPAPADFASLFS
ncbi:DsbA family protein [Microbacterium kunmingense]|uniref:DsbA family protein n=1 Tax=Microbacterium kunmingense TaxID=2915939 RepID=UPI002004AAA0|nr:thioredoxin domain-containing protein [Microbacterium kunmingense]